MKISSFSPVALEFFVVLTLSAPPSLVSASFAFAGEASVSAVSGSGSVANEPVANEPVATESLTSKIKDTWNRLTSSAAVASDPKIVVFSPEGTVKNIRQVRAQFSEPMVPVGDPHVATDIFEIQCPGLTKSEAPQNPAIDQSQALEGSHGVSRWVDSRNWVFDFERDLPGGSSCRFKLKPGVKALSGATVTGKTEFVFSTGGPTIVSSQPWQGSQIEEDQAFLLVIDAKVDVKSVTDHAYVLVEGVGERIPLRVISGPEKEEVLKQNRYLIREAGSQTGGEKAGGEKEALLVQPIRNLPPKRKVVLVWSKEVSSLGGAKNTEDQTLAFETREDFSAQFNCERENPDAACVPMSPMGLQFTAEVPWARLREIRLVGADGKSYAPEEPKGEAQILETKNPEASRNYVRFKGPFPENSHFKVTLPPALQDTNGRPLINQKSFPLEVRTDAFPPLVKFSADFGILEAGTGPEGAQALLPVTLRKVEPELHGKSLVVSDGEGQAVKVRKPGARSILEWIARIENQQRFDVSERRDQSILPEGAASEAFRLPKPNGPDAFEVVGIPLKEKGLYVVELTSPKLGGRLIGPERSMRVSTLALVTDLAIHFKKGREASLAWVTSLRSAKPVAGARVKVQSCSGKILSEGVSDSQGLVRLPGVSENSVENCALSGELKDIYLPYTGGQFVTAETEDDFSFVHTSWDRGIEPWRFNLPTYPRGGDDQVHAILDRSLFRAGETVHMKHLIRKKTMEGFSRVSQDHLPRVLKLFHQGSEQQYELLLQWSGSGQAESEWKIPTDAKLGIYSISMDGREAGSFRVEEFRLPLMQARVVPPTQTPIAPEAVAVDFSVQYLSGGNAAGLPVVLRYQQQPRLLAEKEGWEGFAFANGPVPKGYVADEAKPETRKESLSLDRSGTGRATLGGLKPIDTPSEVSVELEYRDPNGQIQTASQRIPVLPSSRLVGIKSQSWITQGEPVKFWVSVTDPEGKAVAEAPVEVKFVERLNFSHRKKLVGGLYAYENKTELVERGPACSGKTDGLGRLECEASPPASGELNLQASTRDAAGKESIAHVSIWVHDGESFFSQGEHDRMDLLSEKKRYEPGDRAIFQVRMPFREATALVTVEREGVMDAFLVPLTGKRPIVDVPIRKNYAPNAFVSVLAIRGRVSEVQPTAKVDLGRPSFKLGIAPIQVGWKGNELKVEVKPGREVYRVRENAKVRIRVRTADGERLPAGTEAVIAAVDEALLELKPNESWKLLDAMMSPRAYEVGTSTAQSQVVGKRHFGLKALPHGGGGGKAPTRELFNTLLLWKANVKLDAKGEASVEIPLNDSLTSFRIVAVAHGGVSRFGTGSAAIRSTQELMILSGIAPVVREGDRFPAEFTLRNTTSAPLSLEIRGPMGPEDVKLAALETRTLRWMMEAPVGVAQMTYEIEARLKGRREVLDRMKVVQKVVPAVPVRVLQATLSHLENEEKFPVAPPSDALPGRGGVRVALDRTLVAGLAGVQEYMRQYPYSCLEQKASKAIALRDRKLWKEMTDELPSYLDSEGLAAYFPSSRAERTGSDVLTSYLLSISREAGWELPGSSRERMLEGLTAFVEGRIWRSGRLHAADDVLRKIAALEALSRYGKATLQHLASLDLSPTLWPTSTVIDWWSLLRRLPGGPDREKRLSEAEQILRSRLNFQGTRMGFSSESSDALWWMMADGDVNSVRILLAAMDEAGDGWKTDLPRLARGALDRQRKGHWSLTTANAWGVLAIERFASVFEREPIAGETRAELSGRSESYVWKPGIPGGSLSFPWSSGELAIRQKGSGKPWVTVQSLAAIPLRAPLAAGYAITKSWKPVEQKVAGKWSQGDVVRVRLEVDAQAEMTWVVFSDPIPAGSMILGSGLGGDSSLLARGEERGGDLAFEERSFEMYRAYYGYLPKGKTAIEYTLRLNQSGTLVLPPTRVEAMYSPEMFGEIPNETVSVSE